MVYNYTNEDVIKNWTLKNDNTENIISRVNLYIFIEIEFY